MGGVKWRLILERRAIKRCGREGEGEVEVGEVGEGVEVGGGGGGGGLWGRVQRGGSFLGLFGMLLYWSGSEGHQGSSTLLGRRNKG